jgi:hypothetical protein
MAKRTMAELMNLVVAENSIGLGILSVYFAMLTTMTIYYYL